jgi:ribosomal protein S12 methylthiotransferase
MEQADVMVVNSCSFIKAAEDETLETLNELAEWRNENRRVILTGCYVEQEKEALLERFPFVDGVLGTGGLTQLGEIVEASFRGERLYIHPHRSENLLGQSQRKLATPRHYAYLKIAEGCNHACSFCKIPSLRGPAVCKSPQIIIEEAKGLINQGVKEIILVAQDTTAYQGYPGYDLADLLLDLVTIEELVWLRVMYAYPTKVDQKLIDAFNKSKKIVAYLDMPIQHCNDTILKAMKRHGSKVDIENTIQRLRESIPGIKLRTTVLVGFPGETQEQVDELAQFMKKIRFDHAGIFTYSAEANTAAATLRGQVSEADKQARFDQLMLLQQSISRSLNQNYVGLSLPIMIDDLDGGRRTFDAPEIDGHVHVSNAKKADIGQIREVFITDALDYDLVGRIT